MNLICGRYPQVFDPAVLSKLAKAATPAFDQLAKIEDTLNQRFVGMEEPIRAVILSVACGEPLLLVGPPGTAKSRLIRAFCGQLGLVNDQDPGDDHPLYFEYLLTPFTEPGELFGFYNIAAARQNRLVRDDEGMMQNARVVYLDEVFNGSSAILNAILAFLNERIFHDRGLRKRVAMESLFAATNHIPDSPELLAIFDRFVLRCHLDNVPSTTSDVSSLVHTGWQETFADHSSAQTYPDLLDSLKKFRETVSALSTKEMLTPKTEDPFYLALTQLIQHARQYDLSAMSNRRIIKMTFIMMVHRLYAAVRGGDIGPALTMGKAELGLLPRYFLDRYDEEAVLKMQRTAIR